MFYFVYFALFCLIFHYKAASKVPWGMIVFLGAIMFYAGAVGGDDYGITLCLQNILGPVVAKMPIIVTIVIGLIVASLAWKMKQ